MFPPSAFAAIGGLAFSVGAGFGLQRARRERAGFLAMVLAPLIAALAFAAVAKLGASAPSPVATGPAHAAADTADPGRDHPAAERAAGTGISSLATATAPRRDSPEIEALRKQADDLRSAKRYAEARDGYRKLVEASPHDADAWADLADSSAAAAGGDLSAGADALEHALELDPNHPKALWLEASRELQAKRYSAAIELWQRLLAQLPPDSNDARIVSANLEEARQLAGRAGATP